MDDQATHPDQIALKRIMALLLGLAHMAERASLRSLPIRLLLVLILRPAEAYARNLVIEAARDLGYQACVPPSGSGELSIAGGAGNVLRFAVVFEMLAALLNDLAILVSSDGRATRDVARTTGRRMPQALLAGPPIRSLSPLRAICRPCRFATSYFDTS